MSAASTSALSPRLIALLNLPPLMWAGNAIVGRMAVGLAPPIALNALRWIVAALVLALLARGFWAQRPLWQRHWRYIALLGLLGIGCYNALQYWALHTSSPLNVTLIAASSPVWMLLVGWLGYGARPRGVDSLGALCSLAGATLVVARGDWRTLASFQMVQGDALMLLAVITWALYSWMLARPPTVWAQDRASAQPPVAWANWLLAQCLFGILWCIASSAAEWTLAPHTWHWSAGEQGWELAALVLFVALGPSILAFRCWGVGLTHVGPAVTSLFGNLTPIYTALLSAVLLGEGPRGYHVAAFALIALGIGLSARR